MAGTSRFPKDRGLSARMGLTMFLIGLLYVAFVGALIVVGVQTVVILVLAIGLGIAQFWFSDRIALFSMGGRLVSEEEAPGLHAIVDRLCALADMPKPKVAIANVDMPNAFATGRSPSNAVVCVTTGLMRRLEEPEVEAVLSHELSHVAHRDVAVMTIASFLGIAAGLLTRVAFYAGMFGGYGRDRRQADQFAMFEVAVMLISIIVYAISFLLTRALSRYRELAADRAGAILIGRPMLLASALSKVTGEMGRIPTRDLRSAEHFNAFYFAPALTSGLSVSTLFSTHPSLEVRLAQLERLEAEMGRRG